MKRHEAPPIPRPAPGGAFRRRGSVARGVCLGLALLPWAAIVACGGPASESEDQSVASESLAVTGVDAATDARDAGPDVHDAGMSVDAHDAGASVDARTDAHDAGASVDAGPDAHDAATDAHDAAPPPADAGTDAHDAAPDASPCASCDDDNACTTDTCTISGSKVTCMHTNVANNTACDDGNACTTSDYCSKGKCTGYVVWCEGIDNCHGPGTCDPATGICSNPALPDGTGCNNNDYCTVNTTCAGGVCSGTPRVCVAPSPCQSGGVCDEVLQVCTTPILPDGTPCNDGNKCETNETCSSSAGCTGVPVACAPTDQCHAAGTCDPTTGACSNPVAYDGTGCNDGNPCTANDVCTSGACAGTPIACAPSDACHLSGTCSPATGACSNPAGPAGVACGDNSNVCVGALRCDGSGSCVQGAPPSLSTSTPCVYGTCNPTTGVQYNPIPGCGPTTDTWQSVVGRPSPRDGASGVYLPSQNALLLFGGANAGAPLADTWAWNRATNLWSASYASGPSARAAGAVAYDSTRKRVVLFGGVGHGAAGDTFLADTWEYEPVAAKWALAAPASSPPARAYAAIAFDSARGKTVLFGGRGASGVADGGWIWEWDGAVWSQRTATNGPIRRAASAMVYDAARARLVLFGGETVGATSATAPVADTWELDPSVPAWTAISTPSAPSARLGHAMYFDAARSKTVLFGGTAGAQPALSDTWEYDGPSATWTGRATTTSPPGRAGHVLAFDSATGHGLLAGGVSYSATGVHTPEIDDAWEFDPIANTWFARTVDRAPALYRPGLVYDAARATFVLRGDEARPAMWELANGRWTAKEMLAGQLADFGAGFAHGSTSPDRAELTPTGTIYDSVRRRTLLVVRGEGSDLQTGTPPPIWEWDGSSWTLRACTGGPLGLNNAAMAYDTNRGVLVVVGGNAPLASGSFATWEVDSATCTWSQRSVQSPSQPTFRTDPSVAWDSSRNVVVLFGGAADPNSGLPPLTDTWEWDGAAGTWTPRATAVAPPGRVLAGMTFDPVRAKVVLFGGEAVNVLLGDVWEYDGAPGTWTNPQPAGGPSPRAYPGLAFDPATGRTLLFGGTILYQENAGAFSTLHADSWSWDGTSWSRRLLGASPVARSGASGGWMPLRGAAALFGGVRGDGERPFLQDTWIWQDGEWISPSTASVNSAPSEILTGAATTAATPPARAGHAFAVGIEEDPQEPGYGLLFGGQGDTGLLSDTWTWDDQFYTWTLADPPASPPARAGHAMVAFPGTGFLLFGGTGAGGVLLSDTWLFAVNTYDYWYGQNAYVSPSARTAHAMAADLARRKVVLFGGFGATGALQDTWEYDIDGVTGWTERAPTFAPPARFGHAMFYDPARGTVVMVGGTGNDPSATFSDAYEWDGQAGTWTQLPAQTPFGARAGALAFFDAARGQAVIAGGLAYGAGGAEVASYGDTASFARANELGRNGLACAAASTCASGNCVDGVCCNTACSGQCAACDVAGLQGTCTAVVGSPHGARAACGGGPCANQCNGSDLNVCDPPPPGTSCGAASCVNGVASAAPTCDANAVCQPGATTSCGAYACQAGTAACLTSCATDFNCTPGDFCALYGVCEAHAVLSSFTAAPAAPGVGTPITLTATTSAGTSPTFLFGYDAPDGTGYRCGFDSTASCVFTPTESGTYTVSVSVSALNSNSYGPDDSQSFQLTVTP